MTSLTQMIKSVQTDLPITMRHERWITANSDPIYSEEALLFAEKALAGEVGGKRSRQRLFRASGVGSCERKQLFTRIGVARAESVDSKLNNIFHTGSFLHLKWQMAGLTEGWLKYAEVVAERPDLGIGGTLDGIQDDEITGFEFKSINSRGYGFVMDHGPTDKNLEQVDTYFLLREELERFSVVYENKDTGDWREYLVRRDEARVAAARERVEKLVARLENRSLPPVLPLCQTKEGSEYRQCPYRDRCLTTKRWPG